MTHPSGTGGLSALSLQSPFEGSQLGSWVTALSTGLVLPVESPVSATAAERVRFCVALTERRGTFRHVVVVLREASFGEERS